MHRQKETLKTAISMMMATGMAHATHTYAQTDEGNLRPWEGLEYRAEVQMGVARGKTPLWLNANRHGLSSLQETNGYVRGAVERRIERDEEKKWGVGYGVDVALTNHYTSRAVVQQAYVEGRWRHLMVSAGAKGRGMELKNDTLSTGSQTLGVNARPVPQIRMELLQAKVPYTKGWLRVRGHVGYGWMTDEGWQKDHTQKQARYTEDTRYHSKAGYLTIGNEERLCPWTLEMGLEMASIFGGRSYVPGANGEMEEYDNGGGWRSYWNAFMPGGAEANETKYQNVEGDQLGSWVMRLTYDTGKNSVAVYADKFFEDHSAMLLADYNGYGQGAAWNQKTESRFVVYDLKDWLLGVEVDHKENAWLNTVVVEYVRTKYQSGPVYHDHTRNMAYHIGGKDDFYNHGLMTGWQHWGQAIGNPLYRSPLYNDDGLIRFENNRFEAWHLAMSGHPTDQLNYRLMATWQEGLGTYHKPYLKRRHNVSVMGEAAYTFRHTRRAWLNNMTVKAAAGADWGSLLGGPNYGAQLTVTKECRM